MPRGIPKCPLTENEKKERKKESNQNYYMDVVKPNRPYPTEPIICVCGGSYQAHSKQKHMETSKHELYTLQIGVENSFIVDNSSPTKEHARQRIKNFYVKYNARNVGAKIILLKKYLKTKKAKQPENVIIEKQSEKLQTCEEEICNICNLIVNEDGCDCRQVPCYICGAKQPAYAMAHPLEDEPDFHNMNFYDRLLEYHCRECNEDEDEEDYCKECNEDEDEENY